MKTSLVNRFLFLFCVFGVGLALAAPEFETDPDSPELRRLALPMKVDESRYGCGDLLDPGRVFYVARDGDDAADGLTRESAWRGIGRGVAELRAGDTLLVGEGVYVESEIQVNVQDASHARGGRVRPPQVGERGRPIRIFAMPGERVIFSGASTLAGFEKTPGYENVYERRGRISQIATLWEADTGIWLQNAGSIERVAELPGTYWNDEDAGRLYVRFSEVRPPDGRELRLERSRVGMRIHSSYVHVKGIIFTHFGSALFVKANTSVADEDPRKGGESVTVEDCGFYNNSHAGLHAINVNGCLFKNNYGDSNGVRGTIKTEGRYCRDNLLTGNVIGSSKPSIRTHGGKLYYGMNHYDGMGARIHLVGNIVDDDQSFRWKPVCPGSVLEGNVFTGSFYSESSRNAVKDVADRMIQRSNTIIGRIFWQQATFGVDGPGSDWAGLDLSFINNICALNDANLVAEARFADPANLDYRLQSGSPYKGKALGGGDRGAFRNADYRVFYVGPNGDDSGAGDSPQRPFATLAKATGVLRAGDTLYLLEGEFGEPLTIAASGSGDKPIIARAYGRKRVRVAQIRVSGDNVEVEGLSVLGGAGPGALVAGANVVLRRLTIAGRDSAAIDGRNSANLALRSCTLVNNAVGVRLDGESGGATLRDSIIGGSETGLFEIAGGARASFLGSHNVYYGIGADESGVSREVGSYIAEPFFADAGGGDFRQTWDSPAAYGSPVAKTPGACPVVPPEVVVEKAAVVSMRPDSVVVIWETPASDTTGGVRYRLKSESKWRVAESGSQGTRHCAGLEGLRGDSVYEAQVEAAGRRGGKGWGEMLEFRTPGRQLPARTFYVSPQGSDAADGLSLGTAWRTVRKACIEAGPGDTVLFAKGVYEHALEPVRNGAEDRRVTFKALGDGHPVIDGGGVLGPLAVFVRKRHFTVDGLAFDNPMRSDDSGIFRLTFARDIELLNCRAGMRERISWRNGRFITGVGNRRIRVENNLAWGLAYHISVDGSSDILVRNNTFVESTMWSIVIGGKGDGITLENNLWYRPCIENKTNPALLLRTDGLENVSSDYNLFFSPIKGHQVGETQNSRYITLLQGANLAQWQRNSGFDTHSAQADPLFEDMGAGDFRLREGSPAKGRARDGGDIGARGAPLLP